MTTARRRTVVDYAIWAVAGLVVVLLAYLGYAVWAQNAYNQRTSPMSRAVTNLENIVKKSPQDPGARIRLAQAYVAAGRTDDAVRQYNAALKIDPNSADALTGLGLLAMDKKDWSTAQGYWLQVIGKLQGGEYATKDSRLEAAYYYEGAVLMEQRKFEDAVAYLKQALLIRRDASDSHYALSIAYRELGSTKKSLEELKAALLFDPTMPEANYDLGQILLKSGDNAGAAERFRTAVDRSPNVQKLQDALRALGTADGHLAKANALKASHPASATVEARIAVALNPTSAPAVRLLAQLFDRVGKKTDALSTYQKLLALTPGDKVAVAAVARLGKSVK